MVYEESKSAQYSALPFLDMSATNLSNLEQQEVKASAGLPFYLFDHGVFSVENGCTD